MRPSANDLVWAPLARKDLHSLWRYFSTTASAEIANKQFLEIFRVADLLRERPNLGRPRHDVKEGYRSIRSKPYVIYYRTADASVEILRVLHERRDIRKALREK